MTGRLRDLAGEKATRRFDSDSPRATRSLGERIGRSVPAGTTVSLEGGLGAGKTLLMKGICAGLGVADEVLSPTFILVEEYEGELPVKHFDLYRLEEYDEVERIGLFDVVDGRNVVVVEWGDRLPDGAFSFDVRVIVAVTGERSRAISIDAPADLLDAIEEGAS
ncbi:MAG: tRNA (adenosine(37)-N6)-threonylcarbamoyltransferase complex ATPase subunit type 1 TsaE [Candidatus Krumholzibacteriota bacterium]|nr:tRNA (adenosine(37)-N6)-threonylcarbamoyltransferase complex ATPase subunit type 1 TsaE [Candidatus Krumholzibacteriota bacterium]